MYIKENIIDMDITHADLLIDKFIKLSGKTNEAQYIFAKELYLTLQNTNFKDIGTNKTAFLEDLANNPLIHFNDGGHLRQVATVGDMIVNDYEGNTQALIEIAFSNATTIARSNLVKPLKSKPSDSEKTQYIDEVKTERVKLMSKVLNKELKSGKVKSEIKRIKDDLVPDFDKEISVYNIWSYGKLDTRWGMLHNGQIPGQIIFNTIYHYCDKKAKILDPMAGGGTTHDVVEWMNKHGDNYQLECTSFDLVPRKEGDKFVPIARGDDAYSIGKDRSFIIQKNILEEDWNINVENV